jgi:hypothetical protein
MSVLLDLEATRRDLLRFSLVREHFASAPATLLSDPALWTEFYRSPALRSPYSTRRLAHNLKLLAIGGRSRALL